MKYLPMKILFLALTVVLMSRGRHIFADDDPTCSPNEEYNVCGTSCEQTCQEIGAAPRLCNHMCVVGCFCVAGYVRPNGQSNSCIKEADC